MWEYIISVIIGIILYQIIIFIVYLRSNENDELLVRMAVFVPYVLIDKIIAPIYQRTYLGWCRRNLDYYRFCSLDSDGNIHVDIHGFYATKEMANTLEQDGTCPYFVKLVRSCSDIKSPPYQEDIYKGQDFCRGKDMEKYRIF